MILGVSTANIDNVITEKVDNKVAPGLFVRWDDAINSYVPLANVKDCMGVSGLHSYECQSIVKQSNSVIINFSETGLDATLYAPLKGKKLLYDGTLGTYDIVEGNAVTDTSLVLGTIVSNFVFSATDGSSFDNTTVDAIEISVDFEGGL